VQDNGKGFDETQISSSGFGLLGMRERVRLIGGNLRIESTPGSGTHVIVRFPISNHTEPPCPPAKPFNPRDTVAE
jgi:signal transduction histidine kinase